MGVICKMVGLAEFNCIVEVINVDGAKQGSQQWTLGHSIFIIWVSDLKPFNETNCVLFSRYDLIDELVLPRRHKPNEHDRERARLCAIGTNMHENIREEKEWKMLVINIELLKNCLQASLLEFH